MLGSTSARLNRIPGFCVQSDVGWWFAPKPRATTGKGGAMASAVQEVWRLRSCRAASTGLTVPMILDSGDAARVAAIDFQCAPHVGMRFELDATTWEVTRAKDHVRGWVAQPVPLPWSAA